MHGQRREILAIIAHALIGQQMHTRTTRYKRLRQRLCRKQMPTRAACRHCHKLAQARTSCAVKPRGSMASGRFRASAKMRPIVMDMEMSEEPP